MLNKQTWLFIVHDKDVPLANQLAFSMGGHQHKILGEETRYHKLPPFIDERIDCRFGIELKWIFNFIVDGIGIGLTTNTSFLIKRLKKLKFYLRYNLVSGRK